MRKVALMMALVMLVGTSAQAALTFYSSFNEADGTLAGFDANLNVDSANLSASLAGTLPLVADPGKFGKGLDATTVGEDNKGVMYRGNETADGTRVLSDDQGTIEFWFKPNWSFSDYGSQDRRKMLTINPTNDASWKDVFMMESYSSGGRIRQYRGRDGGSYYFSILPAYDGNHLVEGEWNHIAITWDTGVNSTNMYMNGILEGTDTGTPVWPEDTYIRTIGYHAGTLDTSDGSYDDFAIWDEVRYTGGTYTMPGELPEPATMSLLALGGLAMLRRRR